MTAGGDRPAARARIPRWVIAAMVCAAVALVAFGSARLLTPPDTTAPRAAAPTSAAVQLAALAPGADVTGGEPAVAEPWPARVARALSRSAPPVAGPLTAACRAAATAPSAPQAPAACDTRAWKPTAADAAAAVIALRADAWREAALAHPCPGVEDCRTRLDAALGLLRFDPQRIHHALRGAGDTAAVRACARASGAAVAAACAFPAPAGRPLDPLAAAELVTRLEADADLTTPRAPSPTPLSHTALWQALAAATAGALLGLLAGIGLTLAAQRRRTPGPLIGGPAEAAPRAPEAAPPATRPAGIPPTTGKRTREPRPPPRKTTPSAPEPEPSQPLAAAVPEVATPVAATEAETARDAALERFRADLALPVTEADFRAQTLAEAAVLDAADVGARWAGGAIIAAGHFAGDSPMIARAPAYETLVASLAGSGHRLVWPAAGTPADPEMETVARGTVRAHAVAAAIRPALLGPTDAAPIVRARVLLR